MSRRLSNRERAKMNEREAQDRRLDGTPISEDTLRERLPQSWKDAARRAKEQASVPIPGSDQHT